MFIKACASWWQQKGCIKICELDMLMICMLTGKKELLGNVHVQVCTQIFVLKARQLKYSISLCYELDTANTNHFLSMSNQILARITV